MLIVGILFLVASKLHCYPALWKPYLLAARDQSRIYPKRFLMKPSGWPLRAQNLMPKRFRYRFFRDPELQTRKKIAWYVIWPDSQIFFFFVASSFSVIMISRFVVGLGASVACRFPIRYQHCQMVQHPFTEVPALEQPSIIGASQRNGYRSQRREQ